MFENFKGTGLRFSCLRCSACCRHSPGYVFISQNDMIALANFHSLTYTQFMAIYCRWVKVNQLIEKLSLKEKNNFDCIFWANGACSVYDVRPIQCRTFPFWSECVASEQSWQSLQSDCPGINQGDFYSFQEIELIVQRYTSNRPIFRRIKKEYQ